MKKFILLAAVAVSLTACNTEDNYIDDPVAAQFTATIGESAPSRASDVKWDEDDNIGISMSDRYLNIKYTTENGDGIFDGTPMYFQNKVTPETLIAYYPFTGTEGEAPSVIVATTGAERQTPAEQPKFDFLYTVMENVTGSEPNVKLVFSHMMSKLTFIFENGNDGTDVSKITSLEINGFVLEGTFNPVSGVCAAKTDSPASTLNLPTKVENLTALPSILLFPQAVDKVTMKITDSEAQEYSCELKFNGNRLESGNNYVYTITVKKTGMVINKCEIAEWNDTTLREEAKSE